MTRYKVTVPPTMEVGSYETVVSDSWRQTAAQAALQDYNGVRAHDGLHPVRKMPRGTKYTRQPDKERVEELKRRSASSIRSGTNLRFSSQKGFYDSCYNSQSRN